MGPPPRTTPRCARCWRGCRRPVRLSCGTSRRGCGRRGWTRVTYPPVEAAVGVTGNIARNGGAGAAEGALAGAVGGATYPPLERALGAYRAYRNVDEDGLEGALRAVTYPPAEKALQALTATTCPTPRAPTALPPGPLLGSCCRPELAGWFSEVAK